MRTLYGTPVIALSDLVANFNIESGNSGQNHYVDNLVRAARVWEDLMMDTIWLIKLKALKVNKKDNSVKMPKEMLRLINLNIEDTCGNLSPLGYNSEMNTLTMDCPSIPCSCESCNGEGTYCVALDAIQVVLETVTLNGYEFTKRTWTQKGPGGSIQKVIENPYPILPYPVSGPPIIEIKTEYENLCNLDVTPSNCILPTERNKSLLEKHCGCKSIAWQKEMCCSNLYLPQSDYGEWNWKANCDDTIILKNVQADYVIACIQSSGNCNAEEILVPRKALDAINYGIVHRQTAWSPSYNISQKKFAKDQYEGEKDDLWKWMHPVDIDAMIQLQGIIPKW